VRLGLEVHSTQRPGPPVERRARLRDAPVHPVRREETRVKRPREVAALVL